MSEIQRTLRLLRAVDRLSKGLSVFVNAGDYERERNRDLVEGDLSAPGLTAAGRKMLTVLEEQIGKTTA